MMILEKDRLILGSLSSETQDKLITELWPWDLFVKYTEFGSTVRIILRGILYVKL